MCGCETNMCKFSVFMSVFLLLDLSGVDSPANDNEAVGSLSDYKPRTLHLLFFFPLPLCFLLSRLITDR